MTASGWRAGTLLGARTVIGLVVSVGVVVAVGAGVFVGWPTHESSAVSLVAQPVPADTVLSCDGPILAAGRLTEDVAAVSVAAAPTVVVGTAAADSPEEIQLTAPDVTDSAGVAAFVSPVVGREVAAVAAASAASLDAEDLRGLAADACRPALFDSWIVGGAGTTGAADLLLIANPGDVAATVDVTVYGSEGAVVPPGGEAVAIPPRTQRVLPLSGIALGQEGPVVRVAAQGAPVRVSLQSSLVQTLVPLGVDQQSAIAQPSTLQVVPGVAVTVPPGEEGASDATSILRVLAPASDTVARVRVVPVDGSDDVRESTVPLTAGIPVELELGGLPVGRYAVVVEADAELVASVWQSAGDDFAWFTASPELSAPAPFAVTGGAAAWLQVANPGSEDATVVLTPLSGEGGEQTLEIAAGAVERLRMPASTTWLLDPGSSSVYAAVTLAARDALAGYAVWSPDAAMNSIVVRP